ncbi:MAG: hypothetical protein WBM83_05250 [Flavobacteriaceae bacterium]
MKTILTIIFICFIGITAQAQNETTEVRMETVEMTVETSIEKKEMTMETNTEVARLYRRKFSTVKKELSFTTKRNTAKMAYSVSGHNLSDFLQYLPDGIGNNFLPFGGGVNTIL